MQIVKAWVVVLGVSALGMGSLILRDVFMPAAQQSAPLRLASVTRGVVRASVSGTGSVVPARQVNVNFRVAGQLAEIDVKVGDRVKVGQILAKLDPRSQLQAVEQARAALESARAALQAAQVPLTAEQIAQLRHNVSAAQSSYNNTVSAVNLTNLQNANTVATDQQQLTIDQATLNASRDKLKADKALLDADRARYAATCPPVPETQECDDLAKKIDAEQLVVNQDQTRGDQDTARVNADQGKLLADQNKQQLDQANGQSRIDQAQAAIVAAQDTLAINSQSKPNAIAAAQAQVTNAQAGIDKALLDLENTTLIAPMEGVVSSLNGQVGESVGAGAGTTPQAPGSDAPQPASSGATTGSGSAASAFMVLTNDSAFQVVVPFAEADAARLAPKQAGMVTFDAVPGLAIAGEVLAVSASASVVANVVNYYATLALESADPRLKPGMTANAAVTTSRAEGALYIPNSAVRRLGGNTMVMVYRKGGQVATPVVAGLVGDTGTEIKSGLSEGDKVVLPSARLAPSQGQQRVGVPGGPGGGGGGIIRP
jgi:HlyD family secretion protein